MSKRAKTIKKQAPAKKAPAKPKGSAKSLTLIARTAEAAVSRNRQKGEDAIALVARKAQLIAESFYDIALALQILQRKEVYAALGASSFGEIVEKRTPLSRSTAFELVRIPEHLSREAAVQLGSERARSVIQLVEATAADDSAEALVRTDATVKGKPISQQSAVAIRDAARTARGKSKKKSARPGEDEARSAAGRLEARLERSTKKDITVVPTKRRDGWWLRLELPAALADRVKLS